MPDFRCFYDRPAQPGETITLSPEESNHLVAANRARAGDPVRVFNGSGLEWAARIVVPNKRKAELRLETAHQTPPPEFRLALAQALPKGKLLETIIRKATELGVQHVFPLQSARVESKLPPKKEDAKNAKWLAATLEGAKQSGNPRLIDIAPLVELSDFLAAPPDYDLKLIASLAPNAVPLSVHLETFADAHDRRRPDSILWLVGPEGDFTPEETDAALAAGFLPTTLGPHVLRCDTAALHALGIAQYELLRQSGRPA